MKRVARGLLRVGLTTLICSVLFVQHASALTVTTVETVLTSSPNLQLVGYQCDGGGLSYLQFFNSGDMVIDLRDWTVSLDGAPIELAPLLPDVLAPKTHAVAAAVDSGIDQPSLRLPVIHTPCETKKKPVLVLQDTKQQFQPGRYELAPGRMARSLSAAGTSYNQAFSETAASTIFDDHLYTAPAVPAVKIVEIYPYSSDCSPLDSNVLCGDYIKLHNPTAQTIYLDDIVLRTDSSSSSRTTSNTIALSGIELPAGAYHTVWLTGANQRLSLTNSGGYIWLEDTWGLEKYAATLTRYESAGSKQQGYAWAQQQDGSWQWTSTPMSGAANVFTMPTVVQASSVLGECPEGKYRNPETNRCRSIEEAVNALAACQEGQERNPATNRCRSVASSASTLTPCKEGQERNPATNRCRSIASAVAELLPCDEGSERNPATNRCRKVQSSEIPGAAFPVEPVKDAAGAVVAWWAVGGILILGAGYGAWEWRHEIMGGMRKIVSRGRVE